MGVHAQTITKYEIGENKPGLKMLDKMATLYRVGKGWLLEEEDFQPHLKKSKEDSEIKNKSEEEKVERVKEEQMMNDLINFLKELNEARKNIVCLKEENFLKELKLSEARKNIACLKEEISELKTQPSHRAVYHLDQETGMGPFIKVSQSR